jgi:formate dehydrogenase subunit delta
MNTDLMIKMVNEIGAFFEVEPDREQAARAVMGHLQRYWDPRMRVQLIDYYQQHRGAGLTELAAKGVGMLVEAARR